MVLNPASSSDRPLRYQQQMRRFNNARVEVKHRGTLPSQPDVEGFRATVTNFLVETTPELFEIDFNSISLSSLVQSDDVRTALQAAETAAEAGQFGEALEQAAKAFHLSLRNHQWFETPRLFDPTYVARELRQRGRQRDRSLLAFSGFIRSFEAVAEMGESLGEAITILAYHLDYDGYRYLRTYGPVIHIVGSPAWLRIGRRNRRQIDLSLTDVLRSPSTLLFALRALAGPRCLLAPFCRQPQDDVAVALARAAQSLRQPGGSNTHFHFGLVGLSHRGPIRHHVYTHRSAPSRTTPIAIRTSAACRRGRGDREDLLFGDSAGGGGRADDGGGGRNGGFSGGGDVFSALASSAAVAGDVNYSHSEGSGGAWVCGRS